jgi:hypothetical protein
MTNPTKVVQIKSSFNDISLCMINGDNNCRITGGNESNEIIGNGGSLLWLHSDHSTSTHQS